MSSTHYSTRNKRGHFTGSRRQLDLTVPVRNTVTFLFFLYLIVVIAHNVRFNFSISFREDKILSPIPLDYNGPISVSERVLVVTATPTPVTPQPTATPAPSQSAPTRSMGDGDLWATFLATAERVAIEEKYPASVIIGQATLESGRGKSYYARTRNNFFGYMAYDSNPDAAATFETPEASIRAYVRLIKTNPRYARALDYLHDPVQMVREIKAAGYATDPDYVEKVINLPEFHAYR
jgi:hypothetical protein